MDKEQEITWTVKHRCYHMVKVLVDSVMIGRKNRERSLRWCVGILHGLFSIKKILRNLAYSFILSYG